MKHFLYTGEGCRSLCRDSVSEMFFVVNVGRFLGTVKQRKWIFIVKENY